MGFLEQIHQRLKGHSPRRSQGFLERGVARAYPNAQSEPLLPFGSWHRWHESTLG